jgi:hypothetical protein
MCVSVLLASQNTPFGVCAKLEAIVSGLTAKEPMRGRTCFWLEALNHARVAYTHRQAMPQSDLRASYLGYT